MAHKLMEGFKKANSNNLPELSVVTLGVFISKDQNFISPEISNVKAVRNGRESYGESAIRYVQEKREGNVYTLFCSVAPEHKVTLKGYRVELVVDVEKSEILVSRCHDCIAALGG